MVIFCARCKMTSAVCDSKVFFFIIYVVSRWEETRTPISNTCVWRFCLSLPSGGYTSALCFCFIRLVQCTSLWLDSVECVLPTLTIGSIPRLNY